MSARTETRNYLKDVIGLAGSRGTGTEVHARRYLVRNEGLEPMLDLPEFEEGDIKTLCSSVRKSGGTIEDPSDATRRIPKPGFSFPTIAEKR